MKTRAEHERLVLEYLDSTISNDDFVELQCALRTDAGLRAFFCDAAGLEVSLARLFGRAEIDSANRDEDSASDTAASNDRSQLLGDLSDEFLSNGTNVVFSESYRSDYDCEANGDALRSLRGGSRSRFRIGKGSMIGLLAVVAAAFLWSTISWIGWNSADEISVLSFMGGATAHRDRQEIPVYAGFRLRSGDVVSTQASGSITLTWAGETDPSKIHLGGNTTATLTNTSRGKYVDLERGEFSADVAPQPTGKPMILVTPHGRAEVLGTRFAISVRAKETQLRVDHGRVLIGKDSVSRIVESQQTGVIGSSNQLTVTSRPAVESIQQGMLAYWPLDGRESGQIPDIVGSHHARIESSAFKPGVIGNSIELDGQRDILRAGVVGLPEAFSLSLWVISGEWDNHLPFLFANSAGGCPTPGIRLFVNQVAIDANGSDVINNNRALTFEAGNGSHGCQVGSRHGVMKLNVWQHIAVNVNRTHGRVDLFVDGEKVSESSAIIRDFPVVAPVTFGGSVGVHSNCLSGRLDDLRIYDRNLRIEEVRALYMMSESGNQ